MIRITRHDSVLCSQLRVKISRRQSSSSISCKAPAAEATSPEITGLLTYYAAHPPRPLNLSTLLSFGRPLTPDSLLQSASYALAEIPRRLATRVRSLEALPFIVGTNPYVARTLHAYRESFRCIATYPPVRSLDENADFAAQLEVLVQNHANDIPTMARGYDHSSST
jgi:26S proteasome regulatory subunit T1